MLGFAPISTLPLDTLPLALAQAISGTAGFTESGEALLATGSVVNPAVIPPVTTPMGGGVNWRQIEYLRSLEQKPETVKEKKKAVERKQEKRTARVKFSLSPNQLRAVGFVINPITGTARFAEGKTRLRGEGDFQAITENDFMDLEMIEDLLAELTI